MRRQSSQTVQVTFKNIPLCVPDEEIINLCVSYGVPINNEVIYKPAELTRGIPGSTRFVEMKMLPGRQFENFYWMEGPLEGDQGGRVTVLHQVMQCSHCLRRADTCPGGGKGKLCKEKNTKRGEIADYMRHLKVQHNCTSLKMKFREEFPQLTNVSHHDGFGHMKEACESEPGGGLVGHEEGAVGQHDTVQDDIILGLQKQLSEANSAREHQLHEIAKLKASLTKQEESMAVLLNKNKGSEINIRADNFEYDEESDTLKVLDEEAFDKELEKYCTTPGKDREKKLGQLRRRVLSQVKGIERGKRGRNSSICSERSIYSGVGTVRKRSENEDEEEKNSKNPKLQPKSLLPAPVTK